MKILLASLCLLGLWGVEGSPNKIELFVRENLISYSHVYTNYVEDLSVSGMDDQARSAKLSGIWILYEDTLYNKYGFSSRSYYSWGKNYKINSFKDMNGKISSIRYAGADEGLKVNSLNLYEASGFMGDEQYFFQDAPAFEKGNFGQSVIISGCKPWTLYAEANFVGDRICIYPSSAEKCEPGFFLTSEEFGNFGGRASSAKIGCHSKRIVKAQAIPANTSRMFQNNSFGSFHETIQK